MSNTSTTQHPAGASSPPDSEREATMVRMAKHARLGAAWGLFTDNPLLLVIAGIGFSVSFQTIAHLAAVQHMPGPSILYPLLFDALFLGFIIEARKAIDDGRSDLVPRALAWAAGIFTVYVNAHGAPAGDWLGIILHVSAPCAWIAFLELTRWRKLRRKRAERQDGIPLARWLAEPIRTAGMRKRMVVHNVTSYPVAVAREEARLLAIDLTRASLGWRWKHHAPAVLRHHLTNGTLPGELAQACEAATYGRAAVAEPAEQWVTGALAARDTAVAKVKAAKRASEAPAGGTAQGTPEGSADGTRGSTGRGTSRRTRGSSAKSDSWPETKDINPKVLANRVKAAIERYERENDGKRLPALQLAARLRVRMSRDTAGELLRQAYGDSGTQEAVR